MYGHIGGLCDRGNVSIKDTVSNCCLLTTYYISSIMLKCLTFTLFHATASNKYYSSHYVEVQSKSHRDEETLAKRLGGGERIQK